MSALLFEYRAVDRAGRPHRGSETAPSEIDAYRQVSARGLIPVSIRRRGSGGGSFLSSGRFRSKDVAHLTAQLAVLVGARIPLSDGLLSISEQEPNRRFAGVIRDLAARVEAGTPLADAMAAQGNAFGDVYIETIRAAEKSGNLPKVLEQVSEMLERGEETAQQVKSALAYPVCVVFVLLLGMTFLMGFVVPKFGAMYASRGVELPALTQLLVTLGDSLQRWWFVHLGAVVGGALGVRQAWRSPTGRIALDRFMHRVPGLREVLVGLAMGRFARVLGVSLGSGLGLIESLELAGRAAGRPTLLADVERMGEQVRVGGRLSEVLAGCGYIPPFGKRMLAAGENAGELPKMCGLIARHYDRETMHLSKQLTTAIEPIMVVLIAGALLVVALAIFLPMWNMASLIK